MNNFLSQLSAFPKQTLPTLLLTTTSLLGLYLYIDYTSWLSFGTGGSPPTPYGYFRMTKLRLRLLFSRANTNLRDPTPLSPSGPQFLSHPLPDRSASRPRILPRTLPQRQHPHPVPLTPSARDRLFALPQKYCDAFPELLELASSKTEGGTTEAIYARPGLQGRAESAQDRVLGNEIAHVHPAENSLHVWLAEADAREVVEKGWGERFPMAPLGMVHKGFVFVYAPRDESDVEVIERIVEAGIEHLTGVRV